MHVEGIGISSCRLQVHVQDMRLLVHFKKYEVDTDGHYNSK